MQRQGNLQETNLEEILQEFSLSRTTGKLVLTSPNKEGFILFANGLISAACSTDALQKLREQTLTEGIISSVDWEKALEEKSLLNDDELILKVLKTMGTLSSEQVKPLMESQTQNALFDFLSWQEGSFIFYRTIPPSGLLALHVEHLLMEWLQYQEEQIQISKKENYEENDQYNLLADSPTSENRDLKLTKGLEKDLHSDSYQIEEETDYQTTSEIMEFYSSLRGVTYIGLISRDGLYYANHSKKELPYSVVALTSNMWGLINSFGEELLHDEELKSIYLKFDTHIVIFYLLSSDLSLMLIGDYEIDLERIARFTSKVKENILQLVEA